MSDPRDSEITIDGIPLDRARDLSVRAATVAAASRARVFRGLLAGPATPEELARRLELDGRAVSILLPVLSEMELLVTDDDRYGLTPGTRAALADPDDPAYRAGGLPLWLENLGAYTRLPEVLKEGGPLEDEAGGENGEEEGDDTGLARFMAAMAAAPDARIQRLADRCVERLEPRSDEAPPRLLDLGGGPGHMSRVFVERGFRATLFDTPETVRFVAREYGLEAEPAIDLVGGDFVDDPLPPGPFDVVLLSNIVHIYAPDTNRRILDKAARATRPGGIVAVADFLRGRSPRACRFALTMLLRTEEGDTYTADRIGAWMEGAGLVDARVADLDEDRQVMTAVKRESEAR